MLRILNKSLRYANRFKHMRSINCFSTFVSKHFQISDIDIKNYLDRKNMSLSSTPNSFIIRDCPFCVRKGRSSSFKLSINKTTGSFSCSSCGTNGSWYDLKQAFGDIKNSESSMTNYNKFIKITNEDIELFNNQLLKKDEFKSVLEYLVDECKISPDTLNKYSVGACNGTFYKNNEKVTEKCVLYPYIDYNNYNIKKMRLVSIEDKTHQKYVINSGSEGLFGWTKLIKSSNSLIITNTELNALSIYQSTKLPVVSLSYNNMQFPVSLLPHLENFNNITFWMDNDVIIQESIESFIKKLGYKRCKNIKPLPNDQFPTVPISPHDALLNKYNMNDILKMAKPIQHQSILSFDDIQDDIYYDLLNKDKLNGIECETLPIINKTIKGLRRGELTILTGPTGCGKTTLLSQISIDYAKKGVQTLWGSFEITNRRLINKMLQQYNEKPLTVDKNNYLELCQKFSLLPIRFLKFYGSTDLNQVLDAMDYAVYTYDVQHIIIDNLQFMMSNYIYGYEKFDMMDKALDSFRKFSSNHNIHITLVIHPRKEADGSILNISSVFGSAKATQEADNIIILQYVEGKKILDIKKNRFNGELGSSVLYFDKESQKFKQVDGEIINPELKSVVEEKEKKSIKKKSSKSRYSRKKKIVVSDSEVSDYLTQ